MKKAIFIALGIIIFFIISFVLSFKILNRFEKEDLHKNETIEQNVLLKTSEGSIDGIIINNNTKKGEINSFQGIIIDKNDKQITVENPSHIVDYSIYEGDLRWHFDHQVVIDGKIYITAIYLLELDNVLIKDNKGQEITSNELKVGDNINVITKNLEYTVKLISTPITAENIQFIQKI